MGKWHDYAERRSNTANSNETTVNVLLGAIADSLERIVTSLEKEEDKTDALDSGPRDTEK